MNSITLAKWMLIWVVVVAISTSCATNKEPDSEADPVQISQSFDPERRGIKVVNASQVDSGDTALDVPLKDLDGNLVSLGKLTRSKGAIFLTGSYTCNFTHEHAAEMNVLVDSVDGAVPIFFVHTLEAHPSDTVSPYSPNRIWVTDSLAEAGVLANQPQLMKERFELARKLQANLTLPGPILVDNATNEFWANYGQYPNMAFYISPEMTIKIAQQQFDFEKFFFKFKNQL